MEILFVGSLSSIQVLALIVLLLGLIVYSLIMAIRNERGSARIWWVLAILFFPVVGGTAYMAKHLFYEVKTS